MKKNPDKAPNDDEMRPEYDLRGGVRGKYYERYKQGTNVVLLEPDVAKVFRDSATERRLGRAFVARSWPPRWRQQNHLDDHGLRQCHRMSPCLANGLALTRAERAFFASEGTVGFNALLARPFLERPGEGRVRRDTDEALH